MGDETGHLLQPNKLNRRGQKLAQSGAGFFNRCRFGAAQRIEHPKLDAFIERLGAEPNVAERTRIMREEMGPWLYEYMPAVSIGATHSIAGVGPKVGEWPLIPGHMGVHNWEYVTRK